MLGTSMSFSPDGAMLFVIYPDEDKMLVLTIPKPDDLVTTARRVLTLSATHANN